MDKRIDAVYFISRHGYDYYLKTFAASGLEKYHINKLGVKNDVFNLRFSNNQDICTLVSCSNLIPVKRVHLIIEALSKINEINIHWIHIGSGSECNNMINMAHKLLDANKFVSHEFKGFINNDKILEFYRDNYIDCFISTSESEGLPVSMMEAVSFGIPVIATDVGGVSEIVNENDGILLDPECNAEDIKNAILKLYCYSDEQKLNLRKNARLLWEKEFNVEANAQKFVKDLININQGKCW